MNNHKQNQEQQALLNRLGLAIGKGVSPYEIAAQTFEADRAHRYACLETKGMDRVELDCLLSNRDERETALRSLFEPLASLCAWTGPQTPREALAGLELVDYALQSESTDPLPFERKRLAVAILRGLAEWLAKEAGANHLEFFCYARPIDNQEPIWSRVQPHV